MRLYDGTCRGNDAGNIVDLVRDSKTMRVADIAQRIGRGTAYVRSLVNACHELHFTACPRLVQDWVVGFKVNL